MYHIREENTGLWLYSFTIEDYFLISDPRRAMYFIKWKNVKKARGWVKEVNKNRDMGGEFTIIRKKK